MLQDKQKRSGVKSEPSLSYKLVSNHKLLNQVDKKRILETFVENDEALGQLLDFISTKSGSEAAPPSQQQPEPTLDPTVSMTIVDRNGNKIQNYKANEYADSMKINSKSSMKQNMFSKPLFKGKELPYADF